MAISNRIGPPVTGDDFYGRTSELASAHAYLDSDHSLALSAPRRIGKSSFAKRIIEDKTALGWKCVYIDLEGVRTQDEFLKVLLENFQKSGIWKDAANKAGDLLNRVLEGLKGIGPVEFDFAREERNNNLYTALSEAMDHAKDTLVVIDELTLFLNVLDKNDGDHKEAEYFLNWFRSLRQVTDSKIRWIFCGSVGLQNFTRMRNLSMTINDLVSFDFDELIDSEARGLVKALAESEGFPFDDGTVDYFINKIEWNIPYFIQLLFNTVKAFPGVKEEVTEEMIDTAFDRLIRTDNFNTWSERLAEYNGQETGARLILKELSKTETGLTRDQMLNVYTSLTGDNPVKADDELSLILNMIEHDGYIQRVDGGLRRFRSSLLRKWWHYKFVE